MTATSDAGVDRRAVIEELEGELARTPRSTRPYEHAVLAYRLGLAYAEAPVNASSQDGLRRALACYDAAAQIFDPRFDPAEHARVLNAAGAAHRALGDVRRAAELFARAAELFEGRGRDHERAAALNNLGLARSELGQLEAAVDAFDLASTMFDKATDEGRRGWAASLLNRGLAHAGQGTVEGLEAAIADYEEALDELDLDEAPYHYASVHQSLGVANASLASLVPDRRADLLQAAISAYSGALLVFTYAGFPVPHAITKHNLGLAYVALGGVRNLRHALACFEDAVTALDPRHHGAAWKQAYASLERVERDLTEAGAPGTRTSHFVALVDAVDADERRALLGERLLRLLSLPEQRRDGALVELALAVLHLGREPAGRILQAELTVLMELPSDMLDPPLRAHMQARNRLDGENRQLEADEAIEWAIGEALNGPQRLFVRDFLYSLGYERP